MGRPVWRKLSGRPDTIQDDEGADDHKRRTYQAGVPSAIPYFLLLIVSEDSVSDDSKKSLIPMAGFHLPIGSNHESILRRFLPQLPQPLCPRPSSETIGQV
jgi:hypothetical protein